MVCIVGALFFLSPGTVLAQKKKKDRVVPVGVAKATVLASKTRIELPGTVLPWATTQLQAEINGRVEKMLFHEGQQVKKGTLLVQIRVKPLLLQLELAKAERERVAAQLEELQAGTRLESIEAAHYEVEQAQARRQLAGNEINRIKKLFDDGVLSLEDYDTAKSDSDAAQAQLDEKQARLKELKAGPRIEKIKQEKANLKAAEARVRIIQDNIYRASIRAPFDGYIIKKETEVGQWLEQGDPALSMIVAKPLKVEIHVPQFQFSQIRLGSRAKIVLESYKTDGDKEFKGTVIEKIHSGDPASRTFPVRLRVNPSGSSLAAGMLVRVEMNLGDKGKKSLYVPKDAVVRTPRDAAVWVIRPDKEKVLRARKVKVKTGKLMGSRIAIHFDKNQIKPGDPVVVQGNERLKPNSKVKIIEEIK